MHQILALALMVDDGAGKGAVKGWLQTLMFKGLAIASAHPVHAGLAVGVTGMLVMFALRKAVWATVKWVAAIPLAALKQVARPVVASYRAFRNWKSGANATLRHAMPLIGQMAYVGPCQTCGTRAQRRVRTTAFYGGVTRGVDVATGNLVMGCQSCTRC